MITPRNLVVLVAVRRFAEEHGRFPVASEMDLPHMARGVRVTCLRYLEKARLIFRTGHRWDTGRFTDKGAALAALAVKTGYTPSLVHSRPPRKGGAMARAAKEARTVYTSRVRDAGARDVLRPGKSSAKIGDVVQFGRWKGARIYSLTLEERKTCPTTCAQWSGCYGNNMHLAVRWRYDSALLAAIDRDVARLTRRGPIVVRLHILGDFPDVRYINFWEALLCTYPGLRIWGYTAWPPHTRTGAAIRSLVARYPERVAIRYSTDDSAPGALPLARVVPVGAGVPRGRDTPGAFVCPEQVAKVATCAACCACWQSSHDVLFLQH